MIVSWDYDGPCDVSAFLVIVTRVGGALVTERNTSARTITVNQLPVCENLFVRVRGMNEIGQGPQTTDWQFTVPAGKLMQFYTVCISGV